ncbi:hypothetical protein [Actinoplanes cyaneus]|uniref:hypothetical protein n=1 Tax=Actinoplanes cyaneus TaxID=52696 RepID=UPI001943A9E0
MGEHLVRADRVQGGEPEHHQVPGDLRRDLTAEVLLDQCQRQVDAGVRTGVPPGLAVVTR